MQNRTQAPHSPLDGPKPELTVNLHDGTDEQISIIIVHRDRPELLNICLQSITVNSTANNYELIVVDNNSGKDSQDYLDEIEGEVKVVRLQTNNYWSEAANRGAAVADRNSKYLTFLHCDVVILNPSWLDLLINVAESQGSGLVGTEIQSYFVQNAKVDFISEWASLYTRECWNEIGPFNESLPLVGTGFLQTVKAQNKGFKPQIVRTPLIHHYRVFSCDISAYEQMVEKAMSDLPRLMQDARPV